MKVTEISENPDTEDDLAQYFPKRYQQRAHALLKFIRPKLNLDSEMRVEYDDGSTGSNLIDLLRYVLLPKLSESKRPLDSTKFVIWLKRIGAPTSFLTHDIVLRRSKGPININNDGSAPKQQRLGKWKAF